MQQASFLLGFTPPTSTLGMELSWPVVNSILGNGYFFVIFVTLLCILIIGVFSIVKYSPLILHDIRNITNQEFPDTGIILWIVFLFVIPLFFDAGVGILAAWWFLLLWNYMLDQERRIVYVFAFVIILSSWMAHVGAGFITYTDNQVNREIFLAEQGQSTTDDIDTLYRWTKANPDDAEPMNALALYALAHGNHPEAVRLLNRCIDLEPGNARYYNHLAVALTGSGRITDAFKALRQAVWLSPKTTVYHYNLSRLYQKTYSFYESEKSIATASGIDAELVRTLLDQENRLGKTRFILERTPVVRLLSRQMRQSAVVDKTADALWYCVFGIVPRRYALLLGVGFLLVLLGMNSIPQEKFSKKCSRCGKVYYAGARTRTGSPLCLQCSWMESKAKKEGVQIVQHKAEEIRRYKTHSFKKILRMEMAMPGLGSYVVHRTERSVIRAAVLSACVAALIMGGGIIVSIVPVSVHAALYIRVAAVCCMVLLVLRAYRNPPLKVGG